jgi:GNAT superfamily N-acetyltransferase
MWETMPMVSKATWAQERIIIQKQKEKKTWCTVGTLSNHEWNELVAFLNAYYAISPDYVHTYTVGGLRSCLHPDTYLWRKRRGGSLIGSIMAYSRWWRGPTASIPLHVVDFLCVHRDARGEGLAGQLIEEVWGQLGGVFAFHRELTPLKGPPPIFVSHYKYVFINNPLRVCAAAQCVLPKTPALVKRVWEEVERDPDITRLGVVWPHFSEFCVWLQAPSRYVLMDETTGYLALLEDACFRPKDAGKPVCELLWTNGREVANEAAWEASLTSLGFGGVTWGSHVRAPPKKEATSLPSGPSYFYLFNWAYGSTYPRLTFL